MLRQESQIRTADVTLKRLLQALECARSRLAVAMAAERKAIPPARWRSYLEMEDRTRRCLKKLRRFRRSIPQEPQGWLATVESLQRLPGIANPWTHRAEAEHLCRYLGDMLARIEAHEETLGSITR